jgi:hypothetical protein
MASVKHNRRALKDSRRKEDRGGLGGPGQEGQEIDRGNTWAERGGGAKAPKADAGEGGENLGGGVRIRRREDRLAEFSYAAERLSSTTSQMATASD